MKKQIALLLSAALSLSLTACGSSGQAAPSNGQDLPKVGILQLMEHPSLDEARQGFLDGLKEAGYEDGVNLQITYQNAQNDTSNCKTIADHLVAGQSDLILAIATPAAQVLATTTTEIPILVTAVTDPVDAKLVQSVEQPGGNVTGTSDLTPVSEQMELLHELLPDAKTVGLLYCSSEDNSAYQMELARTACAQLNLNTLDATVSDANDLQQVVQSLVGKVDVLYTPSDNTIAGSVPAVCAVADPAGLPFIVGVEAMVADGGLATYGINYYNLGKLTATQAVAILRDGASPAELPVRYLEDCNLVINREKADLLGITIPQSLLDRLD